MTSNHFSKFESLCVLKAAKKVPGRHRLWRVIKGNNVFIPGIIGFLMRHCDTLPLSTNLRTQRLFAEDLGTILSHGGLVLIYPEQAMWWYYPKPRPYRIGAFRYAAKNGVPVVPCFVTLSAKNTGEPLSPVNMRYTIHVCPPIRPDGTHSVREEAERMREENFRLCRAVYERVYGKPLDYSDGELLF